MRIDCRHVRLSVLASVACRTSSQEWDLQALLDKVPELAKKAIAGGLFLGDIDDIADQDDVTAAVVIRKEQYRTHINYRASC